jgi:hypothetical protein
LFGKGHIQILGAKMIALGLNAVGIILLPVAMGLDAYADYAVVQTIALTAFGLGGLGPEAPLSRKIGAAGAGQGLREIFKLYFTRSLLFAPIVCGYAAVLSGQGRHPQIWSMIGLAYLWAIGMSADLWEYLLISLGRNEIVMRTLVATSALLVLSRLALWAAGASWSLFVVATVAEALLRAFIFLRVCTRLAGGGSGFSVTLSDAIAWVRDVVRDYRHTALAAAINTVVLRLDQIAATIALQPVALAQYLFAIRLVEFANFAPVATLAVSFSEINRSVAGAGGGPGAPGLTGLHQPVRKALANALLTSALCALVLSATAFLFSQYTGKMPHLAGFVGVLSIGLLLVASNNFLWRWDAILGDKSSGLVRTVLGLSASVLCLLTIWYAGLQGAGLLVALNIAGKTVITLAGFTIARSARPLRGVLWGHDRA